MKERIFEALPQYVESQKETWKEIQRLAGLAAGADFRFQPAGPYCEAGPLGLWPIWFSDNLAEYCVGCIDLTTGKLFSPEDKVNKSQLPGKNELLTIFCNLHLVNATKIAEQLEIQVGLQELDEETDFPANVAPLRTGGFAHD
jgi:hypothetical protein